MNFQKQPFEFQPAKQTRLAKKLSQVNPVDSDCSASLSLQNYYSMESEVSKNNYQSQSIRYEVNFQQSDSNSKYCHTLNEKLPKVPRQPKRLTKGSQMQSTAKIPGPFEISGGDKGTIRISVPNE